MAAGIAGIVKQVWSHSYQGVNSGYKSQKVDERSVIEPFFLQGGRTPLGHS